MFQEKAKIINKMKNSIIKGAFCVFLIALASCQNGDKSADKNQSKERLLILLSHIENSKINTVVSLSDLFHFDTVYIYPPYTPISQIEVEIPNVKSVQIKEIDDTACLFVFTKDEKISFFFYYPRNKGDFSSLKSIKYHNTNSQFLLEEREQANGKKWLYLKDY